MSKSLVHVSKETEVKSVFSSRNSIHKVGDSLNSVPSQDGRAVLICAARVFPENEVIQSIVPEMEISGTTGGGGQAKRGKQQPIN